jgi:hypothetical protein
MRVTWAARSTDLIACGGAPWRSAQAGVVGPPHELIEDQRATREAVAVYDQSSFGKLLLKGRDACAVLQRLCAKDVGAVALCRPALQGQESLHAPCGQRWRRHPIIPPMPSPPARWRPPA